LNPIEKDLGKEDQKKPAGQLDGDILHEMLMTGDNSGGMFTPNEDEVLNKNIPDDKLHEEISDKAQVKTGKVTKKFGEYQKKFLTDMKKNPEAYMIDTPEGKMNVSEAIKRGYDPATKEFTDEPLTSKRDKELEGLSESDKAIIKQLTDPSAAKIPPKEGEALGLEEGNPMLQQAPVPGAPMPGQAPAPEGEMDPAMIQAMLGGK
jgi:hypothetical protein